MLLVGIIILLEMFLSDKQILSSKRSLKYCFYKDSFWITLDFNMIVLFQKKA